MRALLLSVALAVMSAPALAQSDAARSGDAGAKAAAVAPSTSIGESRSTWSPSDAPTPALAKVRRQCGADFTKHCPDGKPGTPEMTQCVTAHFDAFSGPCQEALTEYVAAAGGG